MQERRQNILELRQVGEALSWSTSDPEYLDEITLQIEEGSIFTILGRKGSGKSALIRLILGDAHAGRGSILLDGEPITDVPGNLRPVGRFMGFQAFALFPHLTVAQNVELGLEDQRLNAAVMRSRVHEVLNKFGLSDLGDRFPGQLSGGQCQRVALARALAHMPKILVVDELQSGLDSRAAESFLFELKQLQKETGITIVMATESPHDAVAISDRIALMSEGRIQRVDIPQRLGAEFANSDPIYERSSPDGSVMPQNRRPKKVNVDRMPGLMDQIVATLERYCRAEPVASAVIGGLSAGAITNSISGFVIGFLGVAVIAYALRPGHR